MQAAVVWVLAHALGALQPLSAVHQLPSQQMWFSRKHWQICDVMADLPWRKKKKKKKQSVRRQDNPESFFLRWVQTTGIRLNTDGYRRAALNRKCFLLTPASCLVLNCEATQARATKVSMSSQQTLPLLPPEALHQSYRENNPFCISPAFFSCRLCVCIVWTCWSLWLVQFSDHSSSSFTRLPKHCWNYDLRTTGKG